MEAEVFSQQGMERTVHAFLRNLREDSKKNGQSYNVSMGFEYVGCDFARKTVQMAYPVSPLLCGASGTMHHGVMASTMDITMGVLSCYLAGPKLTPTCQMNLRYLAPVPVGSRVIVEAECIHAGRTLIYTEAQAWLEGAPEETVYSASGIYFSAQSGETAEVAGTDYFKISGLQSAL